MISSKLEPQLVPFQPYARGVDRKQSRTLMEPGFVPWAFNVWFDRGVVKQRKGYNLRTYTNGGVPTQTTTTFTDPIIGVVPLWDSGGNQLEIVATDEFAFTYNYTDGTKTSIFYNAEDLQCFESAGVFSWTYAPDPSAPTKPAIVFTDGLEYSSKPTLYYFNGTQHASLAAGRVDTSMFADLAFVKQVAYFGDHLLVGDYQDGSARARNGVAWGDVDSTSLTAAGDYGAKLVTDAQGYIKRFIRIGSHLAIYFTNSIVICDPVPTDEIYNFDARVQGTGLLGTSVVDIGGYHVFPGKDNFYLYDGGLQPQKIGDRIWDIFYESLNPNAEDRIVGQHIPHRNLVVFYYPSADDSWAKNFVAWNYRQDNWTLGKFKSDVSAVGVGTQTANYHCNDSPYSTVTCDGIYANQPCSGFSTKAGFEIPTFGSSTGLYFDFSEVYSTDNGTPIESLIVTDSKPLGSPYGALGRCSQVQVESRGTAFKLYYSTEFDPDPLGDSWIPVGGTWGGHVKFATDVIPLDVAARFLALKISFSSSNSSTEIQVISAMSKTSSERPLG